MQNIILIGMPSSGKSTLGVLLAKQLGYEFMDTDLLIQRAAGKLLHEIIAERGTDGFLALENQVNSSVFATRCVISTGGSAIYGGEAMEHFSTLGCIVYLKISYETLVCRLGDYSHRGVILPKGQTLRQMYDQRSRLYERYAHVTVEQQTGDSMSATLEKILKKYQEFCKNNGV